MAIFTEKHLCWIIFLIKSCLKAILLIRDSNTSVFMWILRNFKEHLIWKQCTKNANAKYAMQKSFLLKISPVNVTKSTETCRLHFLCTENVSTASQCCHSQEKISQKKLSRVLLESSCSNNVGEFAENISPP